MGYEIYIHRKPNHWDEQDFGAITLDDLREIHARHPELEFMDGIGAGPRVGINPETGEEIQISAAGLSWIEGFWLSDDGVLRAKYRDDQTLIDALRLAVLLDARVQGDDGEFYETLADVRSGKGEVVAASETTSSWLTPPDNEGLRILWVAGLIAIWTPPLLAVMFILMLLYQGVSGADLTGDRLQYLLGASALVALFIAAAFVWGLKGRLLRAVWRYISGEDIERP